MSEPVNRDVTAVIACYDYGRFLREAVESILTQDGGRPHVIVVDDGSKDPETIEALASLPEDVRVIRQENRGVAVARNRGLAEVTSPYALVLDADDRLAAGALVALRAPLECTSALGFSYGLMRFFGDWEGIVRFPPYDPYRLLYRHTIGLTALVRAEVIEQTGGFDPSFAQYEDWELWVNALAHGWRGEQVDSVTVEYRQHGDSKIRRDRRRYSEAFHLLRQKHAALYRDRRRLAQESDLSFAGRLVYRLFWGRRPVPAFLERRLYGLFWR